MLPIMTKRVVFPADIVVKLSISELISFDMKGCILEKNLTVVKSARKALQKVQAVKGMNQHIFDLNHCTT